jgi:hypothetical protein
MATVSKRPCSYDFARELAKAIVALLLKSMRALTLSLILARLPKAELNLSLSA